MARKLALKETKEYLGKKFDLYEWECPCGAVFVAGDMHRTDRTCDACSERIEAERVEAQRQRTIAERIRRTIENIPPRYQWAAFGETDLLARLKSEIAIARAQASLDSLSVVLLGGAGSGKTSLACAVLRAASAKRNVTGHFETAFSIAKARQEHSLGDGEAPLIERAAEARVLVLDEIGAELARNTAVQEVIHERHAYERPTIYTSGFSADELKTRYGDGIARRIFESATVIRLGGAK